VRHLHRIYNKQSYLGGSGGFFDWAVASGHYPAGENPAHGHVRYTAKEKRQRKKLGFKAFDLEQVRALYAPAVFVDLSPGARWAALLGLYTGARASEVGQLLTVDVSEADGVPTIRVSDEGEHQKVKTEASLRTVPLHPDLLALGFLEYVDSLRGRGDWRLFPQASVTATNGAGNWISKAFSRHLATVGGGWPEAKRGFHSLRKTVIQDLQGAGVASEMRAQIVGHELDDEHHGTYSREFTAAEKLDGVGNSPGLSALAYGLDLAALRPVLSAPVGRRTAKAPGRKRAPQ
jgi:integrase